MNKAKWSLMRGEVLDAGMPNLQNFLEVTLGLKPEYLPNKEKPFRAYIIEAMETYLRIKAWLIAMGEIDATKMIH